MTTLKRTLLPKRRSHAQVLWTDEDNARLVARYPEVQATYNKLKNGIRRADLIRNLYMCE
jgi:mannosyltransferase OCH1-like enzyme